jgi:hypothetical protein|tara:strand:- start:6179 stop:6292 length:114 start_codon:yes stop_codon:yes gene_type:complete
VISNSWKIFDSAAAKKYNRVLLKVVADSGDISRDLKA